MLPVIIGIVVVVVIVCAIAGIYNNMVTKRNRIDNAWQNIDTQLQASLEDTENKISYARQSYNDCVLSYNNAIQTFPAVIFAGIFQFKERQGFEAAEAARQAPTVKF